MTLTWQYDNAIYKSIKTIACLNRSESDSLQLAVGWI
jgi:hypothetical protein